jgi:hypothetical protein
LDYLFQVTGSSIEDNQWSRWETVSRITSTSIDAPHFCELKGYPIIEWNSDDFVSYCDDFVSYIAALGDIGSGKSCTTAKVPQSLFLKFGEFIAKDASFLTLVANGENRATFMKLPPATGRLPHGTQHGRWGRSRK